MLRNRQITVGKYYVNNARNIAREVVTCCDKTVVFITHHLDTGNSCNAPSECLKRNFINWADHEATPMELAKLQSNKLDAQLRAPKSREELNPIIIRPINSVFELKSDAFLDQQSP